MVNINHSLENLRGVKYFPINKHSNIGKDIKLKKPFDGVFFKYFFKYLKNTPFLKWEQCDCVWKDYHLILYGQRYDSKFPTYKDWEKFYS
jgi:hypothetical protein